MTARPSRASAAPRRAPAPAAVETPPHRSWLESRPRWQQHLAALFILWLAFACVFPGIALQGKTFTTPDYQSPSYFGAAGRAALRSGEYPLWNPYLFLGMPSFASLAYTPYVYPPSEILAALGKLPGAPPLAWLVFYYVAAGYGVFLLLRYLHCGIWPPILGGVCFMLMPHLVSWGVFGHGSKLASTAYLPYLALLALRLREPGRRALWTALLALAIGLLFLRAHPQIAFYGLLMLALLGLFEIVGMWRARAPRAEIGRYAAGLGGAVLLGGALAAVLLLPVRAYAPVSVRGAAEGGGAAYQYATNWSFSVSEIATFFLPSAAGFGEDTYVGTMPFTNFPMYLGVACWLFGIAAVVLLRGRQVWFWLVLGILALLISFGRNLPFVYNLFYRYFPHFSKFRVPDMILVLQQLAACVLMGMGLVALAGRLPRETAWRRTPPDRREAMRLLVAAGVMAVFALVLVQPWSSALANRVRQNGRLPEQARQVYADVARKLLQRDGLMVAFLLVAQAGVVVLWWRRKLPSDAAGLATVVLATFDLGSVDRKMVSPEKTWPGAVPRVGAERASNAQPNPLARFLQAQHTDGAAPVRILPLGHEFMNNEWMRWGVASAGGYHPAKIARYEALVETQRQTLPRPLLDLFNVRYLVVPEPLENVGQAPAYSGPEGVAYENPAAQPRAWVTGRYEVVQSSSCKTRLLADDFDRRTTVLLETEPAPKPDPQATGTASVVAFSANRLAVDVEASAAGLVVLAEAYHPGWRARVNGSAQTVLPADCVLRAVSVPAGKSRVELEFVDPALRRGLVVTFVALGAILALGAWGLLRGRVRQPAGAGAVP